MPSSDALIGLIYDAASNGSRWQAVLEAFVQKLGARRGSLAIRHLRDDNFSVGCWHGWSHSEVTLYMEQYAIQDPWGAASLGKPEGFLGTSMDLCPQEDMECSQTFRQFYGPRDCVYGMGSIFLRSDTAQSVLSVVRGRLDGPFGETDLSLLRPFVPHLTRAARLYSEVASMRGRLHAFTRHLDHHPQGFVLTDNQRHVLYANTFAANILTQGDGLRVTHGQLHATHLSEDKPFKEATAAITLDPNTVRRLSIKRSSQESKPYQILLMRASDSESVVLDTQTPSLIILIVNPDSPVALDLEVLRDIFSLTPAEARVTGALVEGRSVDEIALRTRVSVETVRTHVGRILEKTGTRRQAELIVKVLRTAQFR